MITNIKRARNSFCHLIFQMWNPCHFWEDQRRQLIKTSFGDAYFLFSWSDQNFKSRPKKLTLFFYLIFPKKNQREKLGKISYSVSSQTFTYLDVWFWSCGYSCLDCLFYFNSKCKFSIHSFSKKFSINLLHIVSWFRRRLAQPKEISTFWSEY